VRLRSKSGIEVNNRKKIIKELQQQQPELSIAVVEKMHVKLYYKKIVFPPTAFADDEVLSRAPQVRQTSIPIGG